jgi:transcriptional regulator with XRE-family HTH domain
MLQPARCCLDVLSVTYDLDMPHVRNIKHYRLRARMTQVELASAADVARTTIVRLETDPEANPTFAIVDRLAQALGVPPTELEIPARVPSRPGPRQPAFASAL